MQCPNCGFENPEGMKFCGECGAPLKKYCPSCGFENPPQFKFCGECGTSLTAQTPAPEPTQTDSQPDEPQEEEAPEAERRQVTVMFCDLVGSTPLSEQLDPEELREVLHDYQSACAKIIRRFEGHIARYFGDGLMVYFGYPHAHEDSAHRAVRAGLGIVEAMKGLNARLQAAPIRLQVRLGIHTGLVVAGDMDRGERLEAMAIIGATPNIAARLQGLAEPDTLVISAKTFRLIEGFFDCQDLGAHTLKGISRPMTVYQVLHESAAKSRLDVAARTGLTPLVGREQEVGLLLARWKQVKEGFGQVVLLSGEAGIGKSRLVQVLKEGVAGEPHALLECRCSPYYQNSALYPVIDLLQRMLQFNREDSPDEKLSKLAGFLIQYGFSLEEVMPLFASLLSVPFGERYSLFSLTPQRQKQKTLEALLTVFQELAAKQLVLLVVEDLHWVDPSTLELLNLLIDQGTEARILTVLTFRPNFRPPWAFRPNLTHLMLTRLPRQQVELMVERVTGGMTLPEEVLRQVVTKTDGVPLFVEELTKMVLESGLLKEQEGRYELTGPFPLMAIPATLQDSLMARLDRLSTAKEVAQLGATLSREFTYELLQAVSLLDEKSLQQALSRLVEAELLYQQGLPPQATYRFKHALIQETAYESLLKSTRQQYHQQIAQMLAKRFPETTETQPEFLAHHYTEAGLSEQAISYWQQAGQRAIQRSAHVEAIAHLKKGLELLKDLPDTPERSQQELALQVALGVPLISTKGYAAPEAEKVYARARELCQQVGEISQLSPVLRGLWAFYNMRAEYRTARELGEQLITLGQSVQDPALLLEAHRMLGITLFGLGELVSARTHLEQEIVLYDSQQYRSHAFLYGQDPGVAYLSQAALVLWFLGYLDQALERIRKALTLARKLDHPFSLAGALFCAALLHQLRREGRAAQERAEAVITFSTEHGFPFFLTQGTILRGWALAEQGQVEEGIVQMRQGLTDYCSTGAKFIQPHYLALLAEAYGKERQVEEGLSVLAEALTLVNNNKGERRWETELYRLKGELLLMQDSVETGLKPTSTAEAETCLRQAIDVARRQNAKSLELQAVMSLSRLWLKQGKPEEARKLLAEIYGWFTEGFDTANLQEAKALLEELS